MQISSRRPHKAFLQGPECLAFCGFAESIALSAKSLLKAAALLFVALINSVNGV